MNLAYKQGGKMKQLQKIGACILALILLIGLGVIFKGQAKAESQDVTLHVSTTVSPDGGQTWYPQDQPVCTEPGGTVQIQTRVWNTGTDLVNQVYGTSSATNAQYLTDCTPTNPNQDGDDYAYTQNPYTDNGQTHVHHITALGSDTSGYQGTTTTCRIPPETPCDTTITGTTTLTSYSNDQGDNENHYFQDLQGFIGRALAATSIGENTTFTVTINRDTCPKTCGSSTKKTTSETTSVGLPETGSSIMDLINSIF